MMTLRVFVAACVGITTFLVLNALFGTFGTVATSRLAQQLDLLERNVEQLRRTQAELTDTALSLRNDPGVWAIEARSLGLIRFDQRLVKIAAFTPPAPAMSPGKIVVRREPNQPNPEARRLYHALSLGIGMMALVVQLVFGKRQRPNGPLREPTGRQTGKRKPAPVGAYYHG